MNAPDVTLHQARSGEVDAVREILAAAAADLTARFGPGHWSHVRGIDTLRQYARSGSLHVVGTAGSPVGVLRLTDRKPGFFRKEWFARPQERAGYLFDMAVHPHRQRCGIGRRAMALAEQVARDTRWHALRLDAYAGPAGAGEFYRKCGYVLVHSAAFRGVALEYFEKVLSPAR